MIIKSLTYFFCQSFFLGWFSTILDFQPNFFCGHYPLKIFSHKTKYFFIRLKIFYKMRDFLSSNKFEFSKWTDWFSLKTDNQLLIWRQTGLKLFTYWDHLYHLKSMVVPTLTNSQWKISQRKHKLKRKIYLLPCF